MKTDEDNCPRYSKALKLASDSEQFKELQSYFMINFKERFENLSKEKVSSAKVLQQMCSYIEFAHYQKLELQFKLSLQDYQYCLALVDSKQYTSGYGLDELWKLQGQEFIRKLRNVSEDIL